MKVSELPDTERPAFKLRYFGAERLSNTELVQLLTGINDLGIASEILKASDGLPYLHKMSIEQLENISGIGEATACKIVVAMELGRRSSQPLSVNRQRIFAAEDVNNMFAAEFLDKNQEIVVALLLNVKLEVIGRENISKGGIVSAHVEPRDVFRPAVKRGATGVILIHNHPSGDPTPSEDDIYATKQIEQCGELIGIKVIDHIIIGQGRFTSLRDMHLMEFGDAGRSKVADNKDKDLDRERERER